MNATILSWIKNGDLFSFQYRKKVYRMINNNFRGYSGDCEYQDPKTGKYFRSDHSGKNVLRR